MAAFLAGAALVAAAPASAEPGLTRVPVAPPRIVIVMEDEPEPVWRERPVRPEDEILLRGFDDGPPPADLMAGVDRLRAALPPDYLAALMRRHGYVERGARRPPRPPRRALREYDLARFLFDRWVFAAPGTRLAREFACLSWGEFSIETFLTLLTEAEMGRSEAWRHPRSRRIFRLTVLAAANARIAWGRCVDLVGRGWTVER